jgi:hypothetical protein
LAARRPAAPFHRIGLAQNPHPALRATFSRAGEGNDPAAMNLIAEKQKS